ncbi:MAG TPA: hypothetical protein VGA02_00900 [Gemmatimonadales bacterium]
MRPERAAPSLDAVVGSPREHARRSGETLRRALRDAAEVAGARKRT